MSENKYNLKRKKILENLDCGKGVSIMELGMYDLTPYFKMDKFDINLSESIMINKNLARKIEHLEGNLYFSPPQFKALECLYEKDRVILSAPTSFGKTLLVKEYIYKRQPKNIVYIVPTNALAYELEKSFKENGSFSNYIIFDKCSSKENLKQSVGSDENLFFIGTQEKYLELDSSVKGDIDLFVIDEAYKLQDSVISNQRAYKLSETFLNGLTTSSKKIFLLTPKATLSGFDKYDFYVFKSDFNAVEKSYTILNEAEFFSTLLKKGSMDKTILFCKTPSQINDTYEKIQSSLVIRDSTDFVKLLESDIHPDWSVVKLLKSNILTHHGQMPKYVQNKMINLFNENKDYKILFGTNSISEGINTSTKNLFVFPMATNVLDALLLKNTVGRAGRLGKYPIGHIFSTNEIESLVESEITVSLAISDEEELLEIESSKNDEKIDEFAKIFNVELEFCKELMQTYKISLNKLGKIFNALKKKRTFSGITNLPFMASEAFGKEYSTIPKNDAILIRGYLQNFYIKENERIFLNNFDDRITYFKLKSKGDWNNTTIINAYMQFIYSTLEYYIMPIVNIGIELKEHNANWGFGNNVISSIEECRKKYYSKTYGVLEVEDLSEKHKLVISAMKDYGMNNVLKNLTVDILDEIISKLNVRYSTVDIIRAIDNLSKTSKNNKAFFRDLKRRYMI